MYGLKTNLLSTASGGFRKEFYPANFSIAPAQNLGKDDMNPKTDDDEDDDEDGEDEDDAEEEQQPEQMNKKKKRPKQRPYNTYLVKHLGLFSKFRNPRNMHGESRLREHYYEVNSYLVLG